MITQALPSLNAPWPTEPTSGRVWIDTGAGQPLPENHPLAAERQRADQLVLPNLPRLN